MTMLDIGELVSKYNISVKGVIHVGAYVGEEISLYEKLNIRNVIFVEPDPETFSILSKKKSEICNVRFLNVAVSNFIGSAKFYVTNNKESSSLLKLKGHAEAYPNIVVTKEINVNVVTLDSLVDASFLSMDDYNMINMDIQGGEFLALQVADKVLSHIDCINLEVNKTELYEKCGLEEQVDDLLVSKGFIRVAEIYPHPCWGDAFYIRKNFNKK